MTQAMNAGLLVAIRDGRSSKCAFELEESVIEVLG